MPYKMFKPFKSTSSIFKVKFRSSGKKIPNYMMKQSDALYNSRYKGYKNFGGSFITPQERVLAVENKRLDRYESFRAYSNDLQNEQDNFDKWMSMR